jgi:hypothetical protein
MKTQTQLDTMDFKKVIRKIGHEKFLQAFLVSKGFRKAYLIQDFDLVTPLQQETVRALHSAFPNLTKIEMNRGVLFTAKPLGLKWLKVLDADTKINNDHNNTNNNTNNNNDLKHTHKDPYVDDKRLGKLLGYPCYNDYDERPTEEHYEYSLDVRFKDGAVVNVIVNHCASNSKAREFNILRDKLESLLRSTPAVGILVDKVVVKADTLTPNATLVRMMANVKFSKLNLTDSQIEKIWNELENLGFGKLKSSTDLRDPIHRGVIAVLLALCQYDELLTRMMCNSFGLHVKNHPLPKLLIHVLQGRGWLHKMLSIWGTKAPVTKTPVIEVIHKIAQGIALSDQELVTVKTSLADIGMKNVWGSSEMTLHHDPFCKGVIIALLAFHQYKDYPDDKHSKQATVEVERLLVEVLASRRKPPARH